jgi:hypothetical protein
MTWKATEQNTDVKSQKLCGLSDLSADLLCLAPSQTPEKPHVILRGHVGVEGIILKHHADAAVAWRLTVHRLSIEVKIPRFESDQASDHTQERRFPTS